MLIDRILVPLDGSALAEGALPFAEFLAARTNAQLILIREARSIQAIPGCEDYLRSIAEKFAEGGIAVETGVPYAGKPAEWIVEEADVRKAGLIVMATHDRVGPDRWLHGSVAETVVHRATMPVMLVRGNFRNNFTRQAPVLVLSLDGSDTAEAALPTARTLARAIGAKIVLVGVVPNPGQLVAGVGGAIVAYAGEDFDRLEAEAKAYLETSLAELRADGLLAEAVVRYGDPAGEIAAAANELPAAAIVMATHGRAGVTRMVIGSVAGGVLHHAAVPVVLVHPGAMRGAEEPSQAVKKFATPAVV